MIVRSSINMNYFFIFFFCFHAFCYQEIPVPKEDRNFILKEKNHDKVRDFLLEKYNNNNKTTGAYYKIYKTRAEKENHDYAQCISYYYLSNIALNNGDFETAIKQGKSMLAISQKEDNSTMQISALNLLGNINYQIRKYNESLAFYIKAYEINKILNPKNLQLGLLTNINMIRVRIHRYQDALISYQEIMKQLQKDEYKTILNYKEHYMSILLGMGVCHFHLQEYDVAIVNYQEGQNIARNLNSKDFEAIFDMTIGEAYTAKNSYDIALNHLYRANEYFKSSDANFEPKLHTSYFHLATVLYHQEKYQKTLEVLSESFEIIKKMNKETTVEKINEMYDLAYNAAKKLNDKELMIKYGEAYRRVVNSFHLDDIKTKDRLYDQDRSELEAKNEYLISKNQVYISLSILLVLMTLGLLIYHFKKQQKNKLLFEQLQQSDLQKKTSILPKIKKEFVTNKKASDLLQKLADLEKTSFFLTPDCNLYTTAKDIETNTTYLSKVINEHQQKSFNEYINQLRINHCLQELKSNKKFRSYTIKGIAEELGYKSVNTFASAFKKQTGISHSYYLKQILKKETTVEKAIV